MTPPLADLLARVLEAPLVMRDAGAATPADAIVVLGAPLLGDGSLGPVVAERVAAGVALWRRGLAPVVVMTGGVTHGATRAEAEVMADAAIAAGVPRTAIVIEARARSTADNAREVARLLAPGAAVWLVTQPFHARRARWYFRRAGLAARTWHLADSLEYRDRRRAVRWLAREYAAWARAVTLGR